MSETENEKSGGEQKKTRKRRKAKRKVGAFFVKFLLFVALVCGALYGGSVLYEDYQKSKYEALTTLVAQEIVRCAELVSVKAVYSDVIAIRKSAVFGMAKSLMLVKYTGTVRGGLSDVHEITYEVSADRKSIAVTVPHAVILANDITTQEVFDEINNVFVPITTQNVFDQIDSARQNEEIALIKGGFLKQADDYTVQLLTRIFSAMGFESVDIQLQKREVNLSPEMTELLQKAAAGLTEKAGSLSEDLFDSEP